MRALTETTSWVRRNPVRVPYTGPSWCSKGDRAFRLLSPIVQQPAVDLVPAIQSLSLSHPLRPATIFFAFAVFRNSPLSITRRYTIPAPPSYPCHHNITPCPSPKPNYLTRSATHRQLELVSRPAAVRSRTPSYSPSPPPHWVHEEPIHQRPLRVVQHVPVWRLTWRRSSSIPFVYHFVNAIGMSEYYFNYLIVRASIEYLLKHNL
jgi:hypothetical protein